MIWNMTAKVVLIVLQCSGIWATWSPWSTLSTRAPWACVCACGGGGALSVDCCHSKDGRRSPEIEAIIGSRMITWLGSLKRASWISEMPSMHCEKQKECGQGSGRKSTKSSLYEAGMV